MMEEYVEGLTPLEQYSYDIITADELEELYREGEYYFMGNETIYYPY